MERPRVAVFTPVYPPRKGGSATYFSTLVDHLKDRVDFTVITLTTPDTQNEEMIEGVRILRKLPDKLSSQPLSRYSAVIPGAMKALGKMKKEGPFILHAHSNGIYGYTASVFSSMRNVRMLKEVQDTSDPPFVLKAGNVHRYIATGDFVRTRLEGFGIPPERILTFPSINPPDTREIAERALSSGRRDPQLVRFIFVGWLVNRIKGVDLLIEAFKKVQENNIPSELIIIGEGPDREGLEKMSKGLPVRFLGELPREEVIQKMAESDILVLPSHEEANPRCIIEGYEANLPAVATKVGGVVEEVEDRKTGILVPPNDSDALADAMSQLAVDPEKREVLSMGARQHLEGLPTWNDLSDRIYKDYIEIWEEG